jgi:hypothetical protein
VNTFPHVLFQCEQMTCLSLPPIQLCCKDSTWHKADGRFCRQASAKREAFLFDGDLANSTPPPHQVKWFSLFPAPELVEKAGTLSYPEAAE